MWTQVNDVQEVSQGQTKVWGKHHAHRRRSVHIFAACRCVKLWGSSRRWKGLRGHKTQSRCCPTETAQLCCPWLISTLLLKWCRFLYKNQIFSVWQTSTAILCLFCGLISLVCCGISSQRSPPLSVCARLAPCLVVQTNMINEAIAVSRMSCDRRAFDVWHF